MASRACSVRGFRTGAALRIACAGTPACAGEVDACADRAQIRSRRAAGDEHHVGRARGFERCLAHLRSGVDHHELRRSAVCAAPSTAASRSGLVAVTTGVSASRSSNHFVGGSLGIEVDEHGGASGVLAGDSHGAGKRGFACAAFLAEEREDQHGRGMLARYCASTGR